MKKFFKSFNFAFQGIIFAWKSGRNIKIQFFFFLLSLIFSIILKVSKNEFLIILLISGTIISLEMINTSIEKLADVVSPEFNKNIKQVKDIAAGAVLFLSFISLLIGFIIFFPKILRFI
jgi:diacylglycerol kinase